MKNLIVIILFAFTACTSDKQKLVDEIAAGEKKLMNENSLIVDTVSGKKVKELYLKYAEQFKDDTLSGTYLFRAADLSNGMRDPHSAVNILQTMLRRFPDHSKAASALFLQAFLYDTELHSPDSAKVKYREFIHRFPEDPLTLSAEATLNQLESGLSDEELIRKFEMMNDSSASKNEISS
jgi:hypothetical protein